MPAMDAKMNTWSASGLAFVELWYGYLPHILQIKTFDSLPKLEKGLSLLKRLNSLRNLTGVFV